MLKSIIRYRPNTLCAVYVEEKRIEVLRASRKWRSWVIEPAERFQVPEEESVFDYLQYLNIRPRGKKGSALLLILPSTFYSVHREHYPPTLKDQLEEAVNFDWQENIFHEYENTLHFFGPALPVNHHISVPIFSMQREIHDKFYQALNGSLFRIFTVMPSALAYEALLPSAVPGEPEETFEIMGRALDKNQLEVHRFYHGAFLDSVLLGKSQYNLKLFRENLRCMVDSDESSGTDPHIHLLCTDAECSEAGGEYGRDWIEEDLPIRIGQVSDSFVGHWVKHLLNKDTIHTFDSEILLKPWEIPKTTWPILGVVLLFVAYAVFQINSSNNLNRTNRVLRQQLAQLEVQWKPIEALQTRISKFQEDRKTLSEFNREGYPLLELLTFMTQITPEDTWLNYMSLRKGQIVLRGESKSAIRYLSDLSKTEGLADVKFASPVTRNPTSDMERFNVQFQLDMDKLRKSLEGLQVEKYEPPPLQPAGATGSAEVPKSPVPVAGEAGESVNADNFQPDDDED